MPDRSPEDSAEVVWVLLSFLVMDAQALREILDEMDHRKDETARARWSAASFLVYALQVNHLGWLDQFELCIHAEQLFHIASRMDAMGTTAHIIATPDWERIALLAGKALSEAWLPSWPVSSQIDFCDFVECHDG